MIDNLIEVMRLKDEKRSGQKLYNIDDPDSIAAHSWSVALLTIVYGQGEGFNMEKALKLAIVHDLPEIETGDIASRADPEDQEMTDEEKESAEHDAITDISEELNTHELRILWKEYHKKESPEASFVNDMNLIDQCITALKNEREQNYDPDENKDIDHDRLDEFFITAEERFKTETGKELFEDIRSRYEEVKAEKDE